MKIKELFISEEPVISSWIADLSLDGTNVIMTLGNGNSYVIQGIDSELYQSWLNAASKGRFWHNQIKNTYQVNKLI